MKAHAFKTDGHRQLLLESDGRTRVVFTDPKEEKEYRQIQVRVRVLSSLALFLTLGALEVILLGLVLLLAVVIPSAAAVVILLQRYQGRLIELENSDEARWEEEKE